MIFTIGPSSSVDLTCNGVVRHKCNINAAKFCHIFVPLSNHPLDYGIAFKCCQYLPSLPGHG